MSNGPEGMRPRVVTLGCRLNIHESEVMGELAETAGLQNVIIVNTCAVTAEAERQCRQTIRKLRKENPEAYLIATGCAVQLRPEAFSHMEELDRIIGNDIKLKAESFSPDFPYRMHVGPISKEGTLELPLLHRLEGKSRGFVQIQNGCNHQCSFCTIPRARGRSRSVPLGAIVDHARHLLQQGVKELILTGVDLTSYGETLPGRPTLGQMIRRLLAQVPELMRLRLSSVDSIEVDEDLQRILCEEPRMLPHLHLSLQSGSNAILASMRRRHTREDAIALCATLRKARPEFVLGADFIVGHPGETEEDFQDTYQLVEACGLTHLHVFPYSPRPGTLATLLPNPVPHSVAKQRAAQLRERGNAQKHTHFTQQVGQTVRVLLETETKGHTDDFSMVSLTQPAATRGAVIQAQVVGHDGNTLYATPLVQGA